MHNYYRVYDRYRRPVTAVAIFTGKDGKNMQGRYRHVCLGTRIEYVYNTLRIADYPDQVLETCENPFALVMLAVKKAILGDKMNDGTLLKHKLLVAKILLARTSISRKKIKAIFTFLNNYVLFERKETNSTFRKEIDRITNKKKTMNLYEQVAELRVEIEKEDIVKNLLKQTDFSLAKIASITNTSLSFVKEAKKTIRIK